MTEKSKTDILNDKLQAAYDGVVAALRAAGATVIEDTAEGTAYGCPPNKRFVHSVNGQSVDVTVKQASKGSGWHRQYTDKVVLKVSVGYGRGCSQTYPETKDGTVNAGKAAAKLLELVQEAKAKREREARKESREQEALRLRGELISGYLGVEADYDSSWCHCLSGGPEAFDLKLHGLTADQVAVLLKTAVELGVAGLKE